MCRVLKQESFASDSLTGPIGGKVGHHLLRTALGPIALHTLRMDVPRDDMANPKMKIPTRESPRKYRTFDF